MKYIKKFNEDDKELSVKDWCIKLRLKKYTINNEYGTVDVDNVADISGKRLYKIPIQFGTVAGYFFCDNNNLKSLVGSPKEVGYNFNCHQNLLITLEGGPKEVGLDYICEDNQLISLEGSPDKVGGELFCIDNPIFEVYRLFKNDYKAYKDSLDYNYLRGRNIIKLRFQEALEEAGIKMPEYIHGYKYI